MQTNFGSTWVQDRRNTSYLGKVLPTLSMPTHIMGKP
jgi:hypothetical protein